MEAEAITEEPTDLRPLKPAGIGFLTQSRHVDDYSNSELARQQYLIVNRFLALDDANRKTLKETLSQTVDKILGEAELLAKVQTFLVVEYDSDLKDDMVVTIERYTDKQAFEDISRSLNGQMWVSSRFRLPL